MPQLSNPNGRYGRWNKVGIITYVIGVMIQLPFIATGFYTGPLVEKLGGVDISWIVGLVATSIIYYAAIKIWPMSVADRLILPSSNEILDSKSAN